MSTLAHPKPTSTPACQARRRPRRSARRTIATGLAAILTLLTTTLAVVGIEVMASAPAHAVCADTLGGTWRNIDPSTRSVTQVTITMTSCGDTALCDTSGVCTRSETTYSIRTFGKCSPTDCDWGTRPLTRQADGWQRAIYSYSWATKYVWVKTYEYYGRTYLRVWVRTDFTDADGRTDYTSDVWMLR
jgi:hypothetical protein